VSRAKGRAQFSGRITGGAGGSPLVGDLPERELTSGLGREEVLIKRKD